MELHPSIQIVNLKLKLRQTDYKAIKHSEGWLTDEEYAETKAERQRIRDEINRLENEVDKKTVEEKQDSLKVTT